MNNVERRFSFGTYFSAIAHVVLIGWLLLGWGLNADPLPFEVTNVSVVSGEEYAQLIAATTPQPSTETPVAPDVPATDVAPAPDAPVVEPPPDQVAPETPPPDTAEAPPPDAPLPVEPPAEVTEVAPDQPVQPLEQATPDPTLDVAVLPQARPADRVAPEAVQPPPEDVPVAEVPLDAVVPDEVAPPAEVVDPPVEAAAPEEATTEIVPPDVQPVTAPEVALRPPVRPNRVAPAPETPAEAPVEDSVVASTETATPDAPDTSSADDAAVQAALEAALAGTASTEPAAAEGPPMTGLERDAFRVAVSSCWNVDVGSEAANVTVTVSFELGRDGKVLGDIRQISGQNGSDAAINTAFGAARRAILRCQRDGFQLPADKYDQWREVEMTFDPNGMRLR